MIANAWLEDENSGFSNTALFHDEYPKSNSLYATQLVLGSFPEAALANSPRFDGSLVFVNVDEVASTLSATLFCLAEGVMTPIELPAQTLEPLTPYQVDLSSIAAGKVNSVRGAICSAEFFYTGAPGHVIGRYYAASISKTFGVYVKLEPFAGRAYSEVYWTVEEDFSPLLTVASFSAETDTIEVYVSEGESITMLHSQNVEPYGSFTLNMRDLMKPLKAQGTFKGDFGGLYIKTARPAGKLLVKQHAVSGKRLMMAPYYGSPDYMTSHSISSTPISMDLGVQSTASTQTCYSTSGCVNNQWNIFSSNSTIITVVNYMSAIPRDITAQASGSASLTSEASGSINEQGMYGTIYASPWQIQVAQPLLTCAPTPVTRASTINCQLQGVVAGRVGAWTFTGGGATVNRPGAGMLNWSGAAVVGGTVSVNTTGGGTAQRSFSVSARNNFSFTAVSPVQVAVGAPCGGGTLTVQNEPSGGGSHAVGLYCFDQHFTVDTATVSGGPNTGLHYVLSVSNTAGPTQNTAFRWVMNNHLNSQSGAFWTAQCGNWNGATGFISGTNLRTNTIRHESGSSQSHWANYKTAQDNSNNNLGTVAEPQVGTSGSQNDFRGSVIATLDQKRITIEQLTDAEPFSVQHSAAGVFQGNINFKPYQSCN